MFTETPSATIRYTTNGDAPTSGSTAYSGPISIGKEFVRRHTMLHWHRVMSRATTTYQLLRIFKTSARICRSSYLILMAVPLARPSGLTGLPIDYLIRSLRPLSMWIKIPVLQACRTSLIMREEPA
ncbi:MAG: chitobiase/beta-hexosaminidase C-terminal domain-containing protein [Planctomycetota bacterium]